MQPGAVEDRQARLRRAIPCSTPMNATVSIVTSARPSSKRSKPRDGEQLSAQGRCGRRRTSQDTGERHQWHVLEQSGGRHQRARPPRRPEAGPAGCDRACRHHRPRTRRAGVDGEGAGESGHDAARSNRPESRRPTLAWSPPGPGNARVVAADWVTTTSATTPASGASRSSVDVGIGRQPEAGARRDGDRAEHGDAVVTKVQDCDQDGRTDKGRPGRRGTGGPDDAPRSRTAKTAQPDRQRPRTRLPEHGRAPSVTRWIVAPPPGRGFPSRSGSWCTTIITAMPARKPAMIGSDRNSEIQPESQQPHEGDQDADHHGQDRDEVLVPNRPARRQARHPDGEQGRDRRIGAHRHVRVCAE